MSSDTSAHAIYSFAQAARTVLLLLLALPLAAHATGVALPSLAPMVKQATPAVVNIATRGTITEPLPRNPLLEDPFYRRFFNLPPGPLVRRRPFLSAGSGVIVDARNGYIVTNRHVIEHASEITVTLLDGRPLAASVVGSDEGTDLAVLRIKQSNLIAMPLGDSSALQVGDWVVAIGNPFGLHHTVTAGIVSALGRTALHPRGFEDYIQTDAAINPGNSGGALVNLNGELVGINSAILSGNGGGNIGIGFAIPVNVVKAIMKQLIEYGEVKRGIVGIRVREVPVSTAERLGLGEDHGALVAEVAPGSPAQRAGIKAGDIVLAVNGVAIANARELENAIALLRVGQTVELRIVRNGTLQSIVLSTTERASRIEPVHGCCSQPG